MVLLWEGNIYLALLADILSDKLVFKRINERMGTNLKLMVRSLSALKRNAVRKALVINRRNVAHRNRAVFHGHRPGILLPRPVKLRRYLLLAHRDIGLFHLNALVLSERNRRLYRNLRREDKALALLHLRHINGRPRNNLKAALLRRRIVSFRNNLIRRILIENTRTVHLLDNRARCFALAEALHINPALILMISFLKRFFKILCGCFYRKLYHILSQIFNLKTHLFLSSFNCAALYLCQSIPAPAIPRLFHA